MNIYKLFINSTLRIDKIKLKNYLKFCSENQLKEPIKGKTSYHHILPKADSCFPEFADLKVNEWNGVHLLYSDHYIAHSLLHDAVNNNSIAYSWFAMNNMDLKNKNINGIKLIGAEKHQELMEKRSKIASEHQKGKIPWNKGLTKENDFRVQKQSNSQKNIKKSSEHKKKLSESKLNKVTVIDLYDNIKKQISKYEFDNNKERFKGVNYGKPLGLGKKNPMAKQRHIIDKNGNIMHVVNGNFNLLCEEYNLPKSSLYNTLKSGKGLCKTKYNNFEGFIGWRLVDLS